MDKVVEESKYRVVVVVYGALLRSEYDLTAEVANRVLEQLRSKGIQSCYYQAEP